MNSKTQRPSGFNCPVCSGFIPVSMAQLIEASGLECPSCGLHIMINKENSEKAIQALQNVQKAEDNVQKASTFKR